VKDYGTRGLAKRRDQSLDDLFAERLALYRKYADITVNCIGLTHEEVCTRIIKELERGRGSYRGGAL
jgi:shikimate kinase